MDTNLDKKLVKEYPKIFADRYKSMQETCMCWGFECGDGWFQIINTLCKNIQHYLDQKPQVHQVIADQVKEKFGTLSFYYSGGDEYIEGLVDMATAITSYVCENCGNPGKLKNDGWYSVRCEKCEWIEIAERNLSYFKMDFVDVEL